MYVLLSFYAFHHGAYIRAVGIESRVQRPGGGETEANLNGYS